MSKPTPPAGRGKRIGLLAGNGRFPLLLAESARRAGIEVIAVALEGEASPELEPHVDKLYWSAMTKLGRVIRIFKSEGVTQAYMAGGVRKTRLFEGIHPKMTPDLRTLALVFHYVRDNRDHTLLEAVVNEFAKEGICFGDTRDYMQEHLAHEGCMTRRAPTAREQEDIEFGWDIAKRIAELQVGQTIVVKNKCVAAVEAVEGTDEAVRRGGALTRKGAVVIKLARPNQDMRFDAPTIGVQTVKTLKEAGATALAVEAGHTLMLDKPEVIAAADAAKIAIVGCVSTSD